MVYLVGLLGVPGNRILSHVIQKVDSRGHLLNSHVNLPLERYSIKHVCLLLSNRVIVFIYETRSININFFVLLVCHNGGPGVVCVRGIM